MDLNTLWFVLICVLFVAFFFLEGFDYGCGILLPFVARKDGERRVVLNAMGPFWDGNEVWLLTAGGAMFAAFPHWYATLFSGFYLALLLMLVALIVRAVAFEFRSKEESPSWRGCWDWVIFAGSLIPALLWGVALADLLLGVPLDANMNYVGGFFDLLKPWALVGGLATVALFVLHGALFLGLKTRGPVADRVRGLTPRLWAAAVLLVGAYLVWGILDERLLSGGARVPAVLAALALLAARPLAGGGRVGWAFLLTGVTILGVTVAVFTGLFPRVMVSSLNDAWSLTIYSASSSRYTLRIMSIVALCLVPVVLAYQSWSYWTFRKRVSEDGELEY